MNISKQYCSNLKMGVQLILECDLCSPTGIYCMVNITLCRTDTPEIHPSSTGDESVTAAGVTGDLHTMYDGNCLSVRVRRILPAEKLAEFGTFSGKFYACLVCG